MATLNSMRTRWGWIVTGIIGLALIMFVVQDLFTSSSAFFDRNNVGRIAGKSISYENFVEQHDRLEAVYQLLYNTSSIPAEQQQALNEQVWNQMLLDYAFMPSFGKMGLAVGEDEQLDMVGGVYISPVYMQFFGDGQGHFDIEAMKNFLAQVRSNNNAYALWQFMKSQANVDRLMTKYFGLARGGFAVNDITVNRGVVGANTSYDARGFFVPYNTIADSTVFISKSAIKEYYNTHKAQFKQSVSRDVEYVVFDLSPSADDFAAAAKDVATVAEEFRTTAYPMQFITLSAKLRLASDTTYQRASDVPAELKEVLDRGFTEPVLAGTTYTMARLVGSKIQSDTVGLEVAGNDAGRISVEALSPELKAKVLAGKVGDKFTFGEGEQAQEVKLTYKNAPVRLVQIANVVYTVYPSSETQNRVYNATSEFLARSGKSAEGFSAAVDELGLSKRTVRIRPEERAINGLGDGKVLINWAYGVKTKRGSVSEMLQIDGNYVIALLADVHKEGYLPLEQVEAQIRYELINREKARMISARIQGTTLEAMAASVGAEIQTVEGATQTMPFMVAFGYEPKVVGAISALPVGQISRPVAGYQGVFVVEPTAVNIVGGTTPEAQRVRLNSNATYNVEQRIMQAIWELAKVTDMRVRYF